MKSKVMLLLMFATQSFYIAESAQAQNSREFVQSEKTDLAKSKDARLTCTCTKMGPNLYCLQIQDPGGFPDANFQYGPYSGLAACTAGIAELNLGYVTCK